MKDTLLKAFGRPMLAALLLTMFAQISVTAQDNTNEESSDKQTQEDSSTRRENTRKLEGSWNLHGTRLNCQTGAVLGTFSAMFTFTRGGTFWEAGSQLSPSLRSPSHGVWKYESRGHFTAVFQFFRFNADGTLAGKQIVRQQIQLRDDGNSYTSTATAQVLDVNGNVIANNCSTGVGTRFE